MINVAFVFKPVTTTATTTTHIPEVMWLSSVNPKTLHTLEQTRTSKEPLPSTDGLSNEGGKKKQSGQSERKGIIHANHLLI